MRDLVILFIHFIATLARLLGPGGARSIVAESLLLKHQLLILNRSRHRSPNLCASDRILAGLMALLVRPTRLLRSAIVLKPSTLLGLHQALSQQKYRMRQYGSFTRSFTLPSSVDPGQVNAHYDKGVLKINLAKKAEAKPKQIKVNVGSERTLEAKAHGKAA